MVRWVFGLQPATSGPRPARRAAGVTSFPTCSTVAQRLHSPTKRALHEMMYAARRSDCEAARVRFAAEYQAKYPKAMESLTANWERLVSFFDFPAEHWKHAHYQRDRIGIRSCALAPAYNQGRRLANQRIAHGFKLLDMAQQRW